MKTILSPICVLTLLSGFAVAAPEYTMFKPYKDRPVTYYRRPLPPVCPVIEEQPRNITTELALKRRAALWRRGQAIIQAESVFYPSTPARVTGRVSAQPLPPPPVMFVPGPPPGAGPEMIPPPLPPTAPGALPLPMRPPENVMNGEIPTAQAVPGQPGYVVSPWDPITGYVETNGRPSGSEMRDPYTGKLFRLP